MKIIIYHTNIIRIGGVETFTFNMCKQLSRYYDVLLLYKTCHIDQLSRLQQYVECEQYDSNKEYKCDLCIIASAWGGYPDSVVSKKNKYWQIIHSNYKEIRERQKWDYTAWKKTTKHIAVSHTVADIFYDLYKIKCDVMYNILDKIQHRKLKLLSAMRHSPEKGCNRMKQLAFMLKENGIPFRWVIYTAKEQYPDAPYMNLPEVEYREPTYDIFDEIRYADYGVQLSDSEGYSYFVNECLQYGTPMLVTNYDSVNECVTDGYNGYILPMDMKNIDIDKIYNKIPKRFKYEPKTTIQDLVKMIGRPGRKKKYQPPNLDVEVTIKAITRYHDSLLNKVINLGTEYKVPLRRAQEIVSKKKAIIVKEKAQ